MSRFVLRVDTSLYKSEEPNKDVLGFGYEIRDISNGKDEHIIKDSYAELREVHNSIEAELYGIYWGLKQLKNKTQSERVVVVDTICDCGQAIKYIEQNENRFEIVQLILDLVDNAFYSTNWSVEDRSNMYDIDTLARRSQRDLKNSTSLEN